MTDRETGTLAGLWDHFAVPAILETLRVAELAGIDAGGSIKFYATASGYAVTSTSLGATERPPVPAMGG